MNKEKTSEIIKKIKDEIPTHLFSSLDKAEAGTIKVLSLLMNEEKLTAGQLSEKMNVSTARVAVLIKKMSEQKLITKINDPNDNRKTVIEITDLAKEKINKAKEEFLNMMGEVIDEVGEEEINQFINISQKIKTTIEDKMRGKLNA